jgi:hypothetical protein
MPFNHLYLTQVVTLFFSSFYSANNTVTMCIIKPNLHQTVIFKNIYTTVHYRMVDFHGMGLQFNYKTLSFKLQASNFEFYNFYYSNSRVICRDFTFRSLWFNFFSFIFSVGLDWK